MVAEEAFRYPLKDLVHCAGEGVEALNGVSPIGYILQSLSVGPDRVDDEVADNSILLEHRDVILGAVFSILLDNSDRISKFFGVTHLGQQESLQENGNRIFHFEKYIFPIILVLNRKLIAIDWNRSKLVGNHSREI